LKDEADDSAEVESGEGVGNNGDDGVESGEGVGNNTEDGAESGEGVGNNGEDGAESGEGEGVGIGAITTAAPVAPNDTAVSNETTTTQASDAAPIINSAPNVPSSPYEILTAVAPTTDGDNDGLQDKGAVETFEAAKLFSSGEFPLSGGFAYMCLSITACILLAKM